MRMVGGFKQEFDLYNGEPFVNFSADESWDQLWMAVWCGNGQLFPGPNFGK
jgi:hypothetical protein